MGKAERTVLMCGKLEQKRKQEREREEKRAKFPMGSIVLTASKYCSLLKKEKKKSGHGAGRTIQHSHVTVLMRCHLFPSKSCCNMITPLG